MSRREALLEATKELLWQRGYEATSPRESLAQKPLGQGSLYISSRQAGARDGGSAKRWKSR